jgi:tetratricopeptide (TPR) repeat protein
LTSSAPLLVYEFPVPLRPFSAPFVLSVVAVLAVAAAFWALRRRRPALAAAGAVFVIFLSPTLGFFQSGPQMLASRYSTLASLAAAALLAGGVLVSRRRAAAVLLAAAWIAFGAFQTRRLLPAWRDGVAFWRASLKESPGSPLAESNLAAALAARGRTAEALAGLDLALSRNVLFPNKKIPIDLEAQRGWLLMKLGRTGEAEASFRRVLADDPANKGTRNNLGLLLTETGRLDDGLRELWSLVEAFPEYPEGHLSLGVALGRAGRGGEALREFATAEKLSPGMAAAPYNRALLLNALGFRREALLAWEKAARADESILPLPEAPRAR